MKGWIRSWRAFWYRLLPSWGGNWHLKRLAGFERRWGLETEGFTKQGFFRIFSENIVRGVRPGRTVELAAGDGLVGSLGAWLEQVDGWKVDAWEHRPIPQRSIRQHRPKTQLHDGRLTNWSRQETAMSPVGITTRGAREAAGVCRAVRLGLIRPKFIGIWNPTRRPVWERRLRLEGYRLEMVYHRMEFYREREDGYRRTEARGRRTEDGSRGSGVRGQKTEDGGRKKKSE